MPERILIVEDEDKIAAVLRDYLHLQGLETARLSRGDEVLPWMQAHGADLLLLDLNLPGMDGLALCKALRASGSRAAIIMLTARVEEIDRLLGLELGADDYVCKPFSPREVVARVQAQLRRSQWQGAAPTAQPLDAQPQGLSLDATRWRAQLAGQPLNLTAVEFLLLQVLSAQPGRIFTREQLMDAMYRDDRVVADRTVDSHIKKLRRKLADCLPGQELIHSVYGLGYKYEPALELPR